MTNEPSGPGAFLDTLAAVTPGQGPQVAAISDASCDLTRRHTEWTLGRLLAEGREAEVFLLDERTIFRAEKAPQPSSVERALSALRAAQEHGAPVPAYCRSMSIAGREGIAMELLEPENLLHRLGRTPWAIPAVGRIMGSVHAALHGVIGPTTLPSAKDMIFQRILNSNLSAPRRRGLASLERLLPDGRQLLHGDLNPANLLRHPETHKWLAVDWGGAARGDPAADVAYTLVMIARGVPPTPASNFLRALAPVGRLLLASAYLNEYLRHRQLDFRAVLRWRSIWNAIRTDDARRADCRRKSDVAT
jgi:hypothetical protein